MQTPNIAAGSIFAIVLRVLAQQELVLSSELKSEAFQELLLR